MKRYLKEFATHTDYEAYMSENGTLPNVSYCNDNNEVHYSPYFGSELIVAKYTVKDGSKPTVLYCFNEGVTASEKFSSIKIDGVEVSAQELDEAEGYYQLSEGEHVITYELKDPTKLSENMFENCSTLTGIEIPNTVTDIEGWAFTNCNKLTNLIIPNSVTTIGENAFSGCSSLTRIAIPNSVTDISNNAFWQCFKIASITVDSGNTVYDSRDNCNAIIETANNYLITGCKNTVIPNTVTTIGDSAFRYCAGLTSITIPDSVTSIGALAFQGCGSLIFVTIGNGVTLIGNYAFSDCNELNEITIPNSVTSIGNNAFDGCSQLTTVTLNSDEIVSYSTYSEESNLNSKFGTQIRNYIIGEGVTSIGQYAFSRSEGIENVVIPSSVTAIGDGAFYCCVNLASVTINSETPPLLGDSSDTFMDNASNRKFYVPSTSVNLYKEETGWSEYAADIEAIS